MKKQILFLTFFIAAILAGMNSYGQTGDGTPTDYTGDMVLGGAPSCAIVVPLECTSSISELRPQAGVDYTYSVTTAATNSVHWFVIANDNNVVVDLNDITGHIGTNIDDDGLGGDPYILTSDAAYNDAATTSHSTTLSWKSFDGLTEVVLLVAYVTDENDCTDNIEVYRILPVFNFTLDVNALAQSGAEAGVANSNTAEDCVSPIENAIYAPEVADPLNVHGILTADYGENWVYFTVTAANFTHSWEPTFLITYSSSRSEVLAADWAYPADAIANTNWNNIASFDGTTPTTDVLHSGTNTTAGTVGADDGTGECIVVRVQVDHGTIPENADPTLDNHIRMAVNGYMYDQTAGIYTNPLLEDLHFADIDSNGSCDDTDDFDNDWVDYVLTPRPQIISNTGTAPEEFETKEDNIDNIGNN